MSPHQIKKKPSCYLKLGVLIIAVYTILLIPIHAIAQPISGTITQPDIDNTNVKLNPKRLPDVNILTWIGTINAKDPYINTIEKDCGVHLAYFEYKSNQDFLDTLKNTEDHFDIIIFSAAIYDVIANDIADSKGSLYQFSKNYYPIIKQHYLAAHYAPNVAFFLHSMTGFLYNPTNIPHLPTDTISQMFDQATGMYVAMINDPIEADFFLKLALAQTNQANGLNNKPLTVSPLDSKFFKSLYEGTNFIITNTPERIVAKKNFAFAYQWSGDAIVMLRNNPGKLKYYIHPNLSYVSTDLIASLNQNPQTVCVAHKLASEWFLTHEQKVTDYFSPYGVLESPIKRPNKSENQTIQPTPIDPDFKKLFDTWMKQLPSLPWVRSVDENTFNALTTTWDKIKFEVTMQNQTN